MDASREPPWDPPRDTRGKWGGGGVRGTTPRGSHGGPLGDPWGDPPGVLRPPWGSLGGIRRHPPGDPQGGTTHCICITCICRLEERRLKEGLGIYIRICICEITKDFLCARGTPSGAPGWQGDPLGDPLRGTQGTIWGNPQGTPQGTPLVGLPGPPPRGTPSRYLHHLSLRKAVSAIVSVRLRKTSCGRGGPPSGPPVGSPGWVDPPRNPLRAPPPPPGGGGGGGGGWRDPLGDPLGDPLTVSASPISAGLGSARYLYLHSYL